MNNKNLVTWHWRYHQAHLGPACSLSAGYGAVYLEMMDWWWNGECAHIEVSLLVSVRIQYSARAQDGPQEMERNEATAKHVAWLSCGWCCLVSFHILWAILSTSTVLRCGYLWARNCVNPASGRVPILWLFLAYFRGIGIKGIVIGIEKESFSDSQLLISRKG